MSPSGVVPVRGHPKSEPLRRIGQGNLTGNLHIHQCPGRAAGDRTCASDLHRPRAIRSHRGADKASAASRGAGECCAAAKCSSDTAPTRPRPTRTGLLACGTDPQRPPCLQMVRRRSAESHHHAHAYVTDEAASVGRCRRGCLQSRGSAVRGRPLLAGRPRKPGRRSAGALLHRLRCGQDARRCSAGRIRRRGASWRCSAGRL